MILLSSIFFTIEWARNLMNILLVEVNYLPKKIFRKICLWYLSNLSQACCKNKIKSEK